MPSNTTRIAKNTLALYFRQILIMLVSLYTVRVVLNTLGAEDYGIYNVVAGVVVLFSFLNGAMTSATQRFLNYALGQGNTEQARDVYSMSLIIHAVIGLLVVALAETVGIWFFYTWLNIPSERQNAAFVVYQFSVIVTVINILRVPWQATIIAYEKMSFFALVSIVESVLKLGTVFLLMILLFDSLILYALFVCVVAFIVFFLCKLYCNKYFEIAHFRYCNDKKLFRELISFSGWSIFGSTADVSSSYGATVLVNIFYGVMVNAAMGIAAQVNTAAYQFVSNFQMAFNPQIVKSYAVKDYDYFMRLIFQTSKLSFYLLFFFVLPLSVNVEFILQLWLKSVPEYTVAFTRLILISSLVDAISGPLWMSIQAIGNIRKYQIIVSCFIFANLPLSLLFLWLGFSPVWVLLIKIGLNVCKLVFRIEFFSKQSCFPVLSFLYEVIMPMVLITAVSSVVVIWLKNRYAGWPGFILSGAVSTGCIGSLVYFIGLNT
jgi:O-antigen/teichoic acid export membrane protein